MFPLLVLSLCLFLLIAGVFCVIFKNKIAYLGAALIVFSISVPALDLLPNPGIDLDKYFIEMDTVSQIHSVSGLLNFYKYDFTNHAFTFLYDIFQWCISRTGHFSLLPFCSVTIAYLCLIIPFVKLKNEGKNSLIYLFLGYLSIMILVPYNSVASTVRWFLSASIFFLITFLYYHNKNKYLLLLYVPLIFVHEGLILPILVIVFCTIIKKFKWAYIIAFIVIFVLLFTFYKHGNVLNTNSLSNIIYTYSNMNVHQLTLTIGAKIQFNVFLFIPFIYSICNLIVIKDNKSILKKISTELNAFIIMNIIDIILSPIILVAQRYALFVAIFNINLLIRVRENNGYINNIVKMLYLLCILIGLMSYVIGFHGISFNFSHVIAY